jgi:hypothetical protein
MFRCRGRKSEGLTHLDFAARTGAASIGLTCEASAGLR